MKRIAALCLLAVLLLGNIASCSPAKTVVHKPTGKPSESLTHEHAFTDGMTESLTESQESAAPGGSSAEESQANSRIESSAKSEAFTEPSTEEDTEAQTACPSQTECTEQMPSEVPTEEGESASELVSETLDTDASLTEEQTERTSETATEALTEPSSESTSPTEQMTEPSSETQSQTQEQGTQNLESTTQESASETETEAEEEIPIGSLDEELARVGIAGYDANKLDLIALYYMFYYIGGSLPDNRQTATSIRALFDEYFAGVDQNDMEAMTTAVILCYQQAVGDRYATYFDKESYGEQMSDQNAEFVGIGVYVSYDMRENRVQVLSVFKDTPAFEAGILPGDYLVSVDGVGIEEIGYTELVNRIRGEEDSYVTVGVLRDGEALSFTMQRKKVESVSVSYRQLAQDQSIGYVKIEQFDAKTAEQFKKAIDDLLSCGVEGLIFDLRGNPGGEVTAIKEVLDYLLPDGKIIVRFRYDESYTGGTAEEIYIAEDGHEVTLPMTVLCDSYTASAGELFTSALRDHEMATVIGVTTYGKGTAQALIELRDGTAFTISTARYDPPSGENYEGVGITPHIVVELDEEAAKINAFLRDDAIDNQLQAAVAEIDRLRGENLQ
ncbi:MAG: PDZ domain-containing protein [Clostridia bacterium]|nr:PDZ domain-containing protein [Clostridia bacterium]